MSKFPSGSGVAGFVIAGVLLVGAIAWFPFGRGEVATPPDVVQAALPKGTPDAPAKVAAPVLEATTAPVEEASVKDPVLEEEEAALTAPDAASTEVTTTDAIPTPIVPSFDEVRQEADGVTVIAGRAAPDAKIKVLQDGEEIATATADGSGKFAAIAFLAPDGKGHILSLSQTVDGLEVASTEQIILAPVAPIEVAQAAAVPDVDAATDATPPAEGQIAEGIAEQAQVRDPEPADLQTADLNTAESIAAGLETAEVQPTVPQQVAVLKATDQGVELLNTPHPEAMENVALDTISYSDAGDVQLSGRAQAETRSVRVYLDNDAVATLTVDDTGRWRGDLPNVDEGIYTLRVDEVSQDGAVTSRVETPFKRESAKVLANAAVAEEGPLKQITVQKGATLWAIAEQRYGDGLLFVNVFKANNDSIRDPDLIYPGQVFELPE